MMRIFTLIAFCTALSTAAVQFQLIFSSMPGKTGAKPTRTRTALDLRGTHHVSQRALTHICKNIKLKGMVNAISPRTQRRNRSALANRVTPFGKLIQERSLVTKKGGTIRIPFLHPAAMLWICCEDRDAQPAWWHRRWQKLRHLIPALRALGSTAFGLLFRRRCKHGDNVAAAG